MYMITYIHIVIDVGMIIYIYIVDVYKANRCAHPRYIEPQGSCRSQGQEPDPRPDTEEPGLRRLPGGAGGRVPEVLMHMQIRTNICIYIYAHISRYIYVYKYG